MKRPAGVILTSIVLGLFAGLQLLSALGIAAAGVVIGRMPMAGMPPAEGYPAGVTPPPPGLFLGILVGYAVFLLLLAGWAIATLVGLLRLRNWARISALVIGGCLAGMGALMTLGMIAVAIVGLPATPGSTMPVGTMRAGMAFNALMFAVSAAIGVWWLVYYNLRATKAYFVPMYPAGYQPAYAIDARVFAALPGEQPNYSSAYPPPPYPPPPAFPQPPPGRWSKVPASIIVIACLYLLGGTMTMLYVFLPFPGFIAGFILSPAASRVFYLAMGLVSLALGAGLLRLDNRARLGVYVMLALGVVHMGVLLTPWGHARFLDYNAQIYERMHFGGMAAMTSLFYSAPILIFSLLIWVVIFGLMVWSLELHRALFMRDQAAG